MKKADIGRQVANTLIPFSSALYIVVIGRLKTKRENQFEYFREYTKKFKLK